MRKMFILALFILVLFCSDFFAQESGFGLGVIMGEPTGVNFKLWYGYRTALVGAAAWSFGDETYLHFYLDFIAHHFKFIRLEKDYLPFYCGIGVRFKNESTSKYGIRFPLGVNYMFKKVPLDFFAEIVPIFDVKPNTDVRFSGGFGLRYFF